MTVDNATIVHQDKISPANRAWIANGILYNEYNNEVAVNSILENEEKSMEMILQQKIKVIPMIVIFNNINKSTFKIGMKDYSKVITAVDLSKHVSGAWIVGLTPDVKKLVDVVNKVFFAGRMHFVTTVAEAEKGALELLASPSTKTLLE
jgi:hypothetical protein